MFISRFISLVAHRFSHSSGQGDRKGRKGRPYPFYYSYGLRKRTSLYLITCLALFTSLLLSACSGLFGSSDVSPTSTATADLPLAQLHWCNKPFMLFRDEGAVPTQTTTATTTATTATTATTTATATATSTAGATATATTGTAPGTPTTITDWSEVEANLGFTVYLPGVLPRNTCLVSAQAIIHDPTFGGSFLVGYLLPDHTSITISEAPVTSKITSFACYVSDSTSGTLSQKNGTPPAGTPQATSSPTQLALQICSGGKASTSIVLSARRSIEYMKQLFTTLKSNITWIPAT